MAERRLVSEAELGALVAKRLKERQEIIGEAVISLKPELDRMTREISAANHIKRTLGKQISALERSVRQTNAKLDTHTSLAMHGGTAGVLGRLTETVEVIGELGVNTLSQEQRKALPAVLEEHVRTREDKKDADRHERQRQNWMNVFATFASSVAGAVAAAAAILAWLSTHPAVGGTHP